MRLATEAYPVENENYDPEDPSSPPVVWREPLRYDIFEPDGTYLGAVAPPDGFEYNKAPVFDGDHVWAVTQDELGVERVVRYRIEVGDRGGDRGDRGGGRSSSETSFALRTTSGT